MPPNGRKGRSGGGQPYSEIVATGNGDKSEDSLTLRIAQLYHRPIGPGELASLRALWWSQASTGHGLPAEIGVI